MLEVLMSVLPIANFVLLIVGGSYLLGRKPTVIEKQEIYEYKGLPSDEQVDYAITCELNKVSLWDNEYSVVYQIMNHDSFIAKVVNKINTTQLKKI